MNANGHVLGWETWARFRRTTATFLASPEGRRSVAMMGVLIAFLVVINGLNVINSYVGRDFISAIEGRDRAGFVRMAWLYVGVFALSTVAAVVFRFVEERLALLWRTWQTHHILDRYLAQRAYYRIEEYADLPNPDQRIAEDIRAFTTTTLSFALMTLNATVTIVAFSGVLWSISPRLFGVAVLYALVGSALTVLVGRRLVGLNVRQLDMEANFRSELLRVREYADEIALLQREPHVHNRLLRRLDAVVANTRRIIAVNRNLGFFTNGYNYLIQIIPALIVAPLFMQGDVPFGVITQSAMAFSTLMGAFSLAVTQFQSISAYAAVIGRLGRLTDAIAQPCPVPRSAIETVERDGSLVYEKLTLRRPDGRLLLRELDLVVEPGRRVRVSGAHGHAKVALFRATAGLSCEGEGRILRPGASSMLFVPELPYLPAGSLRELLLHENGHETRSDAEIHRVLHELQLDVVLAQAGGLDVERDWGAELGVSEQAGLVVARVLLARPQFAFFDRMSVAMDGAQMARSLRLLGRQGIGYLVLAKPDEAPGLFDAALDIAADGSWTWTLLTPAPVPA
ncbi:SbmA/BacA-like family transporter [Fontimonas sp. SYSU GA230001]|uniref:ABC transporter ATP-binding protein/permease n=1 Tax=Fontimonas sp. SYSU GA230001 TaxID=3142450 RepID=UPI0032B41B7D